METDNCNHCKKSNVVPCARTLYEKEMDTGKKLEQALQNVKCGSCDHLLQCLHLLKNHHSIYVKKQTGLPGISRCDMTSQEGLGDNEKKTMG